MIISPVVIDRFYSNFSEENATGFFYQSIDHKKWLVTARHILFSSTHEGRPFTRISMMLNKDSSSADLRISLREILAYGKVHSNDDVDLVMIELTNLLLGRPEHQRDCSDFGFFVDSNIPMQEPKIGLFVCMIGYPQKDLNTNKSSLKTLYGKVIQCPTKLDPRIRFCFCIDQSVVPGMSGSPVISKNEHCFDSTLRGVCVARLENGKIGGAVLHSYLIKEVVDNGISLRMYIKQKGLDV